jgi:hypothetical protein
MSTSMKVAVALGLCGLFVIGFAAGIALMQLRLRHALRPAIVVQPARRPLPGAGRTFRPALPATPGLPSALGTAVQH